MKSQNIILKIKRRAESTCKNSYEIISYEKLNKIRGGISDPDLK